jgi:hypothetical protein
MSLSVFLNLRGTHHYRNLPVCKQLSFYFLLSFSFRRKEIFISMGTYKIGGAPPGIMP